MPILKTREFSQLNITIAIEAVIRAEYLHTPQQHILLFIKPLLENNVGKVTQNIKKIYLTFHSRTCKFCHYFYFLVWDFRAN